MFQSYDKNIRTCYAEDKSILQYMDTDFSSMGIFQKQDGHLAILRSYEKKYLFIFPKVENNYPELNSEAKENVLGESNQKSWDVYKVYKIS